MNKRTSVRFDFSSDFIPVKIITNNKTAITCILKDISSNGVSFYSFGDILKPKVGTFGYITFTLNGNDYKFELEVIRENKKNFGYMSGARIIGINTLNDRKFNTLLTSIEKELYSFS